MFARALFLAVAVLQLGCSLLVDFDRFEDAGGAGDGGPSDGGGLSLSITCAGSPAGSCVLDEGMGTGLRGIPAEIRVTGGTLPEGAINVTTAALAPVRVIGLTPPSSASVGVIGIVLLAPIDEMNASGQVEVPLAITVAGNDVGAPVSVGLRWHPELHVAAGMTAGTVVSGIGYSNIILEMTSTLAAVGPDPLELTSFGDVHISPLAALNVDASAMVPGAGGGAGGASAPVGMPGGAGSGAGGGVGGVATPAAGGGGGAGHALAGSDGSALGSGGAAYGDAMLGDWGPGPAVGGSGAGAGGSGTMGSGGAGGHGGGGLRLVVGGSVTIDGGARISADGASGAPGSGDGAGGGGGSGGVVWIAASEGLFGTGAVTSLGGTSSGTGGAGSAGYVRLDVPDVWEPTATPFPQFLGLKWESSSLPTLTDQPSVTATLWGQAGTPFEVEVRSATGALVTIAPLSIGASGSADVAVTLTPGWNALRGCTPTCADADSEDEIAIVSVP